MYFKANFMSQLPQSKSNEAVWFVSNESQKEFGR